MGKNLEVYSISGPTMSKETVDVTNFDSIGSYREKNLKFQGWWNNDNINEFCYFYLFAYIGLL